jgi:protein ImuB
VRHDPSKTQAKLSSEARRYLAIWLPYLPTQRLRSAKQGDAPFVLVDKLRGGLRIMAMDAKAKDSGLTIGMALAAARARIPGLAVDEFDGMADRQLLLQLAESCEVFSPLIALDGPDGLLIDITGCTHLFGGERAIMERLRRHVERWRLTPCISIADTPDAAHVLARFKPFFILCSREDKDILGSLPITALEAPIETTLALTRAGLKTLGDLVDRPSQVLAARFGAELVTRLKRTMGHENIRITPLRALPDLTVDRHFPEPLLNADNLHSALARLCDDICMELERRGAGGRAFEATFFRSDGKIRRIPVETAQAMRNAKSLLQLLSLRLETISDPLDPGFGFDAIRLSILRSEPLEQSQNRFDGGAEDNSAISALIDRLVVRFGRERVVRFIARDTHDPLRAAALVPVASPVASADWQAGAYPLPRPLQIFHPPHPIDVIAEVPDSPPRRFRWRKVLHDVAIAEGPERIEPEWWRPNHQEKLRDYYHVEDREGRRFWIYREGLYTQGGEGPHWFLQGLFP